MKHEKGNRIEFYKEQAEIYFKKQIPVHILKKDGIFYNGKIIEIESNSFFIDDFEEGRLLIFFHELKNNIVEFREKRNG